MIELALLGWFCLRHPEPLFPRLFLFGMVVGWTELLNDTWLVRQGILVYDPGGPFVIDTPLYMPFCWALIFVTTGTIGYALQQKLGPLKAPLAMAVISGLYIPGFEAIAAKADWWFYQHVPMLLGLAPWFVVLGEALLALPLPWMATRTATRRWPTGVVLGVVEGLVIWATTVIALRVVG